MVILLTVLAVVVVVGIGAMAGLGPIVTWYVNLRLRKLPDYTGSVGKISFMLFRGQGVVKNAVFRSRSQKAGPPLLKVAHVEIDIACRELFFGRVSVALRVESVHFHWVVEPTVKLTSKEARELGSNPRILRQTRRWQEALQAALPVEITALEITRSSVEYVDASLPLPVPLKLEGIELKATGLINRSPTGHVELPAKVDLRAVLTGNGQIRVTVEADPMARQPRFQCRLALDNLDLPVWNSLLIQTTKLDLSAGTFSCVAEIEAGFGFYRGYIKPFFENLNFHTAADARKGFLHNLFKTAAGWVAKLLESERGHQVATKIPFEGNFEDNHIDLWTAIASLLQNAFFRGLREGLEGSARRFFSR